MMALWNTASNFNANILINQFLTVSYSSIISASYLLTCDMSCISCV